MRKKYAIVGASHRGMKMYAEPIYMKFGDVAQITGVYDINRKRAELMKNYSGGNYPVYGSFEDMMKESKPDILIVTVIDKYHHEYVIKGLEAGCDVIVEKPLTIDADKANAILECERKTGKKVIVTFNARCEPLPTKIKQLVKEGSIGKILSVHFEYLLDTVHGADYFRRWHRRLENSGGLLVHKSTHHFDLINWFLEDVPEEVHAFGTRSFYGAVGKIRGERCLTCSHKDECEFFLDITQPLLKEIYLDCEDADGYFRDRCVFSEDIDIYDTASVNTRYSQGALMSYSLVAYSPYEGYKLNIKGTEGRIEAEEFSDRAMETYAGISAGNKLRIYNRRNEEISYGVPVPHGMHSGADDILQKLLFKGSPDSMGFIAGSRDGVLSLVIGAAANKSIEEGRAVLVKELLGREVL